MKHSSTKRHRPEEFEVVDEKLRVLLTPVIAAVHSGNPVRLRWDAAGS